MAYELSASIAAGTATAQDVAGTANGQHSGGRFSPDGSIIGSQRYRLLRILERKWVEPQRFTRLKHHHRH